jgi:hypothetical protein
MEAVEEIHSRRKALSLEEVIHKLYKDLQMGI